MDKSRMPNSFSSHHQWYSSIVESIKTSKTPTPPTIYTYKHAIHGFSASLSKDELERLKRTPGLLVASEDKNCVLDTTHTPEFISLSQSTGLWPSSKFGEDIVIGVVDSGIWPESESFKDDDINRFFPPKWKGACQPGQDFDSSTCNFKLIGARYFNGGLVSANPSITIGMNSTRDTIGHGTATASVAAGNYVHDASYFGYGKGTAKGVAPRARIAAYKVAWDEGIYASDVLAGIDQAIEDDVDVILVPIGCDNIRIYEDPVAIGSFTAMEKGIVVVTSSGNGGTLHNGIPWVTTVAAGTVDRLFAGTTTLSSSNFEGWTLYPANALIVNAPFLLADNQTISECNSSEQVRALAPAGSVILCYSTTWPVRNQIATINNVSDHVSGAIVINTDSSVLDELVGEFPCPAVVVNIDDENPDEKNLLNTVKELAKSRTTVPVSIKFQETYLNRKQQPAAAFYSSRGPSPYYPWALKPDVMAPGTQVLAAWPPNLPVARIGSQLAPLSNNFNVLSGTSLAAAHVAGVAALLKAAHPEWSPAAIRSTIITTANPLDNTGEPIRANVDVQFEPASALVIGAGQIDADRACDPGLVYDIDSVQDYVDLLCDDLTYLSSDEIRAITRRDFNCIFPINQLNYPSFILLHRGTAAVTTIARFVRTVTNVGPMATATYKVSVKAPKNLVVTVMPETLVFRQKGEKQTYRVEMSFTQEGDGVTTYGELVWEEQNGSHTVRSPIVTARAVHPPLAKKLATF